MPVVLLISIHNN